MITLRSNSRRGLQRGWMGQAVLIVLVLYPLSTLLLQIFFPNAFAPQPNWHWSFHSLTNVFSDPANVQALLDSAWIGAAASCLSVAVGFITAIGRYVAAGYARRLLDTLVWFTLIAPSFVIASGWVMFLQTGGVLQQGLGLPGQAFNWFFSPFGLLLVMSLRYYPFAHFALVQAIEHVGDEYVRAARMAGATPRTAFWGLFVRMLTPGLLAGATIAFAEGFSDFGLASVLTPNMQIPLISYQIYSALFEIPTDFPAAALLSALVILVTAGALVAQFKWLDRRGFDTLSGSSTELGSWVPGRRWWRLGAMAVVTLSLVLPFASTLLESFWKSDTDGFHRGNWTWANYAYALQSSHGDLTAFGRTAIYALVTAVIAAALGLVLGWQLIGRPGKLSRWIGHLTVGSVAIPGIVLGVAYVFAWNASWLEPLHMVLYGTPMCLLMAYIAGQLPYAVRLQMSAMAQIPPNLLTAAQMLGAGRIRILTSIVMPLVSSTFASSFLIALTGVMFELPVASMLYPPGQPPFSVQIDHLFADFEWAPGSALTVLGIVAVGVMYGLARVLLTWILPGSTSSSEGSSAPAPSAYAHDRDEATDLYGLQREVLGG